MADKAEKDPGTGEQSDENNSCVYRVKWIDVEGVGYAIVMQNENGPCPLLAIINVLLLRGQISLRNGVTQVNEKELLQLVADCVLRLKPKDIAECELPNYEQNVSDVITLIPSLPRGLDVNIHFTGVKKFEYTPACALFDMLNIPLMHGWIVDSDDQELLKLVDGLSYNQIVEKVVSTDDESESCLLRNFLDVSASQLTTQGIAELLLNLDDGEIAVLFRNNHFQTLSKHKDVLYVLVTDMGFLGESSVIWETLDCVDGNSTFVNATFRVPAKPSDVVANESADYLLALSIQEDERERVENRSGCMEETAVPSEEHDIQREIARGGHAQAKRPNKSSNDCLRSTLKAVLFPCLLEYAGINLPSERVSEFLEGSFRRR